MLDVTKGLLFPHRCCATFSVAAAVYPFRRHAFNELGIGTSRVDGQAHLFAGQGIAPTLIHPVIEARRGVLATETKVQANHALKNELDTVAPAEPAAA